MASALYARLRSGRTTQFDIVAIGGLIVSIATLAWQVYTDHRSREPNTSGKTRKLGKEVIRTEIRREVHRKFEKTPATLRITEVVIDRILTITDPDNPDSVKQ